jgi:MFS transporter, DHA1 family, multidrug resistance protein
MTIIMATTAVLSLTMLLVGRTRITNPVLLQEGGDAVVIH